jgi:predicted enzyme related to lactoylglutathione lyase
MKGRMKPHRPVSVTLYVRDRDAAVQFYESALGMRWNPDVSSFQFGEYPRVAFFLVSILDSTDDPAHPVGAGHFGYVVPDVGETHRRAVDAGAKEWYPPQDNAGAPRSSGLNDPDGNRVELWQA